VQAVIGDGRTEQQAYAICAKSTGWVKKKGGWRNKKEEG